MSVDMSNPISAFASALGTNYTGGAPEPPQPKASLMTIPVDLRLEIYSYLLHQSSSSSFSPRSYYTTSSSYCSSSCSPINGSLLRANRQINREATDYLYADNEFLAHPSLLSSFPRIRPDASPVKEPSALSRIRRLRLAVRLDCEPGFTADQASVALSGLDELTVHVLGTGPRTTAVAAAVVPTNLRLLEGVRGIRHVSFCGGARVCDDYLAWLASAMMAEPGTGIAEFVSLGTAPDAEHHLAEQNGPEHNILKPEAVAMPSFTAVSCGA